MTILFQKYIGVFDIAIIILFLVGIFVGYKCGFFTKIIKIANWICGALFAFLFCNSFANLLSKIMYSPIYKHIYDNIYTSNAFNNLSGEESSTEALSKVLSELGLPKFIAQAVSQSFDSADIENIRVSISSTIGSVMARFCLVVIAFLILLIGTSILFFILRKIIEVFREAKGFRIIDGIMGIFLYTMLTYLAITVFFLIVTIFMQGDNKFTIFMRNDLRLEDGSGCGIARWFYTKNLIGSILKLIF